jgi:hypothetical protein
MFAVNGLAYRSTDSGATWEESGPKYDFTWQGPEHRTDVTSLASDGNAVYAGVGSYLTEKGSNGGWASGGLWRSTDDGSTWNAINNGLPYAVGTTIPIGGIVATKEYLLAAAARGSIYRSTNGGNSWSLSTTGLQYDENFAGSGQLFQVGGITYLHQNGATYQSNDGGITWSIMSPALPDGFEWTGPSSTLDDKFYTQTYRRLGDTAIEYHLLMLEGGIWNDISSLQPEGVRFGPMVRAGNYIYAGSFEHGVWKEYLQKPDISSSVRQPEGIQAGMELTGYPNPTKGTAEVRYNLAERSQTILSLVNSIGEEIERMDLGMLQAGEHVSQLDMGNLPAGAYMLRLTANGHARQGRIVKID